MSKNENKTITYIRLLQQVTRLLQPKTNTGSVTYIHHQAVTANHQAATAKHQAVTAKHQADPVTRRIQPKTKLQFRGFGGPHQTHLLYLFSNAWSEQHP